MTDPFEGYVPPPAAGQIKLEEVGDWFSLTVAEIGDPFEAEYGEVFTIAGEVRAFGGPGIECPEVGEDGSFMLSWEKKDGKPAHIREEIMRAVKAAGRRSGALLAGDTVSIKRDRDDTHSKAGKKFANPFRHHAVIVTLGAESDDPWGSEAPPM